MTIDAPGGGGYGSPLEREPEMVEADVAEGYVTPEQARSDYGVVIDLDHESEHGGNKKAPG